MIAAFRVAAALAAGLSLAPVVCAVAPAAADDYPSRPITMIIPLAPGGSTDVLARIMAEGMRKSLGQPVIPENTSGAGGTIGVTKAERSAPDGYTILFGQFGTNMANGAIYSLDFDLVKDFQPIALVATQPFFISSRKDAAGQQSERTDRLDESQWRKNHRGQFGRRLAEPHRRHSTAADARF